jgi:LytS/YehU family sensor histidine kinase
MGGFRRFVINLSGVTAAVLIIANTIIEGIGGALLSEFLSGGRTENMLLGFLIGAASGFFVAALPCAIMFMLAEVAENTRRIAQLLEVPPTQQPQAGQQAAPPPPRIRIRPE